MIRISSKFYSGSIFRSMTSSTRSNPISLSEPVYVQLRSESSNKTTSKAIEIAPGFGDRNIIPIPYIPSDTESHREYPGSFDGIHDGWCMYGREPDTRYKDAATIMIGVSPAGKTYRILRPLGKLTGLLTSE
jgi:hypothetical protein